MRKHILFSLTGLAAGLAALWWIQPSTSAGATFLLTLAVVLANAAAALIPSAGPGGGEDQDRSE
jgi:hypothetical protein